MIKYDATAEFCELISCIFNEQRDSMARQRPIRSDVLFDSVTVV
jgi:hypothetical protein